MKSLVDIRTMAVNSEVAMTDREKDDRRTLNWNCYYRRQFGRSVIPARAYFHRLAHYKRQGGIFTTFHFLVALL